MYLVEYSFPNLATICSINVHIVKCPFDVIVKNVSFFLFSFVGVVLNKTLSRTEAIYTHGLHLGSMVDPYTLDKQVRITFTKSSPACACMCTLLVSA